jgi:hypothetical protein
MYADNARPHVARQSIDYMEQNEMKLAPYPPYSSDLASFDFYLFGHVNGYLSGNRFEDADELFGAVQRILDGIENVTLQAVFLDWIERFEKCIATDGEYVE